MGRKLASLLAAAALGSALVPAAASGSALVPGSPAATPPVANAATDHTVSYLDTGKLKVVKTLRMSFICAGPVGSTCLVTANARFLVPGPNPAPVPAVTAVLPANTELFHEIRLSKRVRGAIKKNVKKVKLRSSISGQNSATGEFDEDSEVFRFKK